MKNPGSEIPAYDFTAHLSCNLYTDIRSRGLKNVRLNLEHIRYGNYVMSGL